MTDAFALLEGQTDQMVIAFVVVFTIEVDLRETTTVFRRDCHWRLVDTSSMVHSQSYHVRLVHYTLT